MSGRRTNKHKTGGKQKKERDFSNMMVTRKGAQYLTNALIEQGECPGLQRAVDYLQAVNDHVGKGGQVMLCSFCARKIGVQRCSGCRGTANTRYCSKECQLLAWPSHKQSCNVLDVE